MLTINDLQFSDLYLSKDFFSFKHDGQVSRIDDPLQQEAAKLFDRVMTEYAVDGRNEFTIEYAGQRYRVVILDSISGSRVVLRRINSYISPWDKLGFPKFYLQNLLLPSLQKSDAERGGLILIAGRPDSGKTTTCYSLINTILNKHPWACMTIEDPVETILPETYPTGACVTQLEVPSSDFASALKSGLRANKDLIMVGEIRDSYGAQLAIAGAQTGHLVITTLHAADIPNALERFIDIAGHDDIIVNVLSDVFRGCIWQTLAKHHGLENRILGCQSLFSSKSVASRIKTRNFAQLVTDIERQKIQLEQEVNSG